MRTVRLALAMGIIFVWAAAASAHGGGPHVMGTVKSVAEKALVVTDTSGKEVTITVDDKTKVESKGKAAKLSDLATGERVVVHTRNTDSGLVAVMVKVGGADSAPSHHDGAREHEHEQQPTK